MTLIMTQHGEARIEYPLHDCKCCSHIGAHAEGAGRQKHISKEGSVCLFQIHRIYRQAIILGN